ncbi:MAG: DUF29 domain-containing protein [Cyanothece sp. SIO2G6]|nr:DUF29 domain-containing protein [Cyanothece sp. SIO2G6]
MSTFEPLSPPQTSTASLYDHDFYTWVQKQSDALQNHRWQDLDLPNLVEELESLGKQQRRELSNRLSVLLAHLLNWEYQSQHHSRSGLATIRIQRLDIADLLEESPSLKTHLEEAMIKAYPKAVQLAIKETELPERTFPVDCPYGLTTVLNSDFYPGIPSDLVE